MAKRNKGQIEAIEPAVNGLEDLQRSFFETSLPAPPEIEYVPENLDEEADIPAVVLIFGNGEEAEALGVLAQKCGLEARVAAVGNQEFPWATEATALETYDNIVEDCGIERNFFICILEDSNELCELLLSQALASDAGYIGFAGDRERIADVFEELRKDGVPDAELAAVAAPMGLDIGARTPEEKAVAIVAEMLAAKAGKLKRMRQSHK